MQFNLSMKIDYGQICVVRLSLHDMNAHYPVISGRIQSVLFTCPPSDGSIEISVSDCKLSLYCSIMYIIIFMMPSHKSDSKDIYNVTKYFCFK